MYVAYSLTLPSSPRSLASSYPSPYGARGLGAVQAGERTRLAQQAGGLASAGLLLSAAAVGGPVGAAIGAAAVTVKALTDLFTNLFSGCGQTCVQATRVVDTVEAQYLKPLLEQWTHAPVKTRSLQKAYLQVFDYAAQMVMEGCGDPALGDAGRRCISERLTRGGEVPGTGGNWLVWYRDPIANDPSVVEDAPGEAAGTSLLTSLGVNPAQTVFGLPLGSIALPAALIGLALLLPSGRS